MANPAPLSSYAKRDAPGGGLLTLAGLLQLVALFSIYFFLEYITTPDGDWAQDKLAGGLFIFGSLLIASAGGGIWLWLRVRELRKPLHAANQFDFDAASLIKKQLPAVKAQLAEPVPSMDQVWPGIFTYHGLVVRDLLPLLDAATSSAIEAWLNERVSAGLPLTRAGTAPMARPVLQPPRLWFGQHFSKRPSEGMVAVMFEPTPDGWRGPIHVVIPSDTATRAFAKSFVTAVGASCGNGSYRDREILTLRRVVNKNLVIHATDAAAWLTSLSQVPWDRRPPVGVTGVVLPNNTVLAGALHANHDGRQLAYKLFPIALPYQLPTLVEETTLAMRPPVAATR